LAYGTQLKDPCVLRTIHRFLKAGVLDDGVFQATESGMPTTASFASRTNLMPDDFYKYWRNAWRDSVWNAYVHHAARLLFKWLNRRSQSGPLTWKRFGQLRDDGLLPKPRIVRNLYLCRMGMT